MNKGCWVTTSWDDGHPLDFKLADLLTKYELPATFYIPLQNPENAVMDKREIKQLASRFEIGGHTVNHKTLTHLSPQACQREIVECKMELENMLGESVKMFCYPKGKYTKKITQLVAQAGYEGARTAFRYWIDLPTDRFQVHTTFVASPFSVLSILRHAIYRTNPRGVVLFLRFGMPHDWVTFAEKMFDYVLHYGGVWHLWGHSWEIEEKGQWVSLQKIMEYVSGHRMICYVTNRELINNLHGKTGDIPQ